ncbi:MAG: radical SAM protein [Bacteroidota bacterium]
MRPVLCNYYVTYRCNAKCGFCDIWEQPSPLIDLADAARNLDDLRRIGVRVIDFTGGEPLLHPQLPDLLRMAKERGFLTTVTSNGLLYPKRAEALRGLVDLLHFSIDAPTAEEHDASRGVKCFGKLMESIEVALRIGERPDLLFTVTNESVRHLDTIYEQFALPNKLILIVNPLFEYHGLGAELSDDVMARMRTFAKQPYTYLNPAFLTLRARGGNDPANPVCKAVSTTVVISPFNELVLPCYHAGLEKLPIKGRLHDLWQGDRVAYHREHEGRLEVCRGCTVNCYFEPSFATTPTSGYFWEALPSKVRYSWTKFVVQRLRAKLAGPRTASLPDFDTPSGDGAASGDGAPPRPVGRPVGSPPAAPAELPAISLPVLKSVPARPPAARPKPEA